MTGALDGITVVDLTQGMAGAIATMFLCDNGARVVRVERPGGDSGRLEAGMVVKHEHPTVGPLTLMGNLVRLADTAHVAAKPTPMLGEHTRAVLQELGYPNGEIDRLYKAGVVKTRGGPGKLTDGPLGGWLTASIICHKGRMKGYLTAYLGEACTGTLRDGHADKEDNLPKVPN